MVSSSKLTYVPGFLFCTDSSCDITWSTSKSFLSISCPSATDLVTFLGSYFVSVKSIRCWLLTPLRGFYSDYLDPLVPFYKAPFYSYLESRIVFAILYSSSEIDTHSSGSFDIADYSEELLLRLFFFLDFFLFFLICLELSSISTILTILELNCFKGDEFPFVS